MTTRTNSNTKDQGGSPSGSRESVGLERPFRLFAVEQRVLAQNVDGKVIDIGAMESKGGEYCARLDVDDIAVEPKRSPELALKALVEKLTFDYLDGLFTSEGETEVAGRLQDFPSVEFELEENLPRDMVDRTPPHLF
ncbi:hypothetical protein P9239_11050 [Caballeronia sp. LZ062]|uniref:hypothetical protein n=1 Tax=unclassified Caballeronia TaxID=2646786 RepID=UPI002857EE42|nr:MULTISPECIES: hypothetical protein [unclassified Caballeronia]MDR5854588.1 hypothetical protein [Caballeronia sp. LZ050]MDR5870883.1 hypothetical protein [Caballeronia sp. LZ062]